MTFVQEEPSPLTPLPGGEGDKNGELVLRHAVVDNADPNDRLHEAAAPFGVELGARLGGNHFFARLVPVSITVPDRDRGRTIA